MTRGSIREYTEAVRGRYFLASKKEKGKIWDELFNLYPSASNQRAFRNNSRILLQEEGTYSVLQKLFATRLNPQPDFFPSEVLVIKKPSLLSHTNCQQSNK